LGTVLFCTIIAFVIAEGIPETGGYKKDLAFAEHEALHFARDPRRLSSHTDTG